MTAPSTTKAPVLIVEDDGPLRELLTIILEGEGFEVESAANGEEALARLIARPPAVLLLDMRMPVMDGWQLVLEIDRSQLPRPPIVVLTAATDPAERAEEVRADAWLAKPFDRDELLSLMRSYMD